VSNIYCQECGFLNPEAANYCARCGALLVKEDGGTEATQTFTAEEGDDAPADALEDLGITGPALVVRSGGGRAGETFHPEGETTIGRSRDGAFVVEDQGSLNGTFVNRKRVESAQLEDGDELQIGKYRLTFLNR
jgi:hypothetical protein